MSNKEETKAKTVDYTPVRSILNDKWDVVLSNMIVKMGLGFGVGVVTSVLFFKRRSFPVWLGVGFGAGRGYSEGDAIFRSTAGLRSVKV
ncbi:uncharacterized protein GVI51_B00231 [Nakaseomyces glabratus]|uniref:MICOS complex subunit MIC10 n=2 Tax=Candida glabrata TaxID=5478 RepID=Q6FX67_CANGA|nr:uncharacterized protein CAGL0B00396g [Nakaseomyces glabratus]KAH7590891.1 protein of unknown function (DUF543) [Nakaseomyces glabratus]KAH7591545.1 protein of unknown function (DUF543) [Nakaseomyces glabratus]KAH7598138.1 protein of unknown function (DUF543) [Nakaseomyces glabratus]KAH7608770.1 protein of unknown function (DUF543) [Nakaseomyces glabratus]KAH7609015.1 protein of unknown function (DUF543) [Nakaseomyces glabratus]|eukprot:XP_444987.2 uncharacterized protein CAGL0B00396g [[Candida] glabrata]